MWETKLGDGFAVSALGLGCSSMSHGYGPGDRDDEESARVLHQAVELGITLFDTADVYGPFTNEELLGRTLKPYGDRVRLATKCGLIARPDGKLTRNGRPEHLRAACEASLRRLRKEAIDLYQLHRIDPEVPLAETWGALGELVTEGKVRALGISHATTAELGQAHSIFPLTTAQYELSVWAPENAAEVLPWCRAHGVGFLAFAPIGRGFLSGKVSRENLFTGDSRNRDPRFDQNAMLANEAILAGLRDVCARHEGATPSQVAIAWVLAQGPDVVPIPGTRRLRWLAENAAATELRLTEEDMALLDGLPTAMGEMRWDSVRPHGADLVRSGRTGRRPAVPAGAPAAPDAPPAAPDARSAPAGPGAPTAPAAPADPRDRTTQDGPNR